MKIQTLPILPLYNLYYTIPFRLILATLPGLAGKVSINLTSLDHFYSFLHVYSSMLAGPKTVLIFLHPIILVPPIIKLF